MYIFSNFNYFLKYNFVNLKNYHFYILEIECEPPCVNHGVCGTDPKNPDDHPVCFCPSGYFGETCEQCKIK